MAHANTLIFGWIKENPGFIARVEAIRNEDTIAPAVAKGDTALLKWVNEEIDTLNKDGFIADRSVLRFRLFIFSGFLMNSLGLIL